MKLPGRMKPYMEDEISSIPCARCGKPSSHQWQVCSLGNRYLTICTECDIQLNDLALEFMNVKHRKKFMTKYRERMYNGYSRSYG